MNSAEKPVPWEPFDPQWCRSTIDDVLRPIVEHWFRPQIFGADRIPEHGPVILASNHSGNALPYDAIVLDGFLWQRDRYDPAKKLRTVFEPALAQAWWLRPFGVANFWRRAGAVDMTFDNFERLLERGDRVLYYPEGVPGIGKGFQNRYKLREFKTSFVLLAHRQNVPVVPIYTINAEWVMPFHFTLPPLDRLFQRLFGVPFLPLPAGLLAMLFPFLWYIALPAHMIFVCGERIDVQALVRDMGVAPDENPSKAQLRLVAARIRDRMQTELSELVRLHGQRPYHFRGLFSGLRRAKGVIWRVLPTGWPVSFLRHERDLARPKARSRVHAFLRDLDLLAFYLPFGWPLLTLARRLRKPPYGFRHVRRSERKDLEGEFVWRLSQKPLPPRADQPAVVSPTISAEDLAAVG
jgi:1-acyl-sn-glycerol-3-phosphate acyltransferase